MSADGDVLLGSSTFTADTNYDFFVAVHAPSVNVANALVNGNYIGAWLEFAPGATQVTKSGLVSLAANGTGQFSRVAVTNPGVFSRADGCPVVLHADYSIASPENPARPGETVLIWLTGLGELSPAVAAGQANPAAPLARAVDAPIKVLFGGVPAAALDYAGGAPGFAGLCQVNVTIPLNSPLGPSVPVAVSTSNAHTELVEIPISR